MSVVSLFSFRCSPRRTTAQIMSCTVHLQEWPGTSYSENASMDNIFGRKIGSIFESGLSEAGSAEQFIGLFESLEEK